MLNKNLFNFSLLISLEIFVYCYLNMFVSVKHALHCTRILLLIFTCHQQRTPEINPFRLILVFYHIFTFFWLIAFHDSPFFLSSSWGIQWTIAFKENNKKQQQQTNNIVRIFFFFLLKCIFPITTYGVGKLWYI